MATTKPIPQQFTPQDGGLRLGDFEFIRQAILNQNSMQATYGIVAAGTTQATATPLGAVLNQVDTTPAGTGVNLPLSTGKHSTPCQFCFVTNNGASTLQIYGAQNSSDTVNGVAAATGISLVTGQSAGFYSTKGGAWFTGDTQDGETLTSLILAGSSSGSTTVVASAVAAGTETIPGFAGVNTIAVGQTANNTALYNIVNTTTLAAIPGLSLNVVTSGTYEFLAKVPVSTATSSGISLGLISTAGPVTATSYAENGVFMAAAAMAVTQGTTFGNAVGSTTNVILAELSGVLQVNTGGTIALAAATNVASTVTSTINTNGFLQLMRIS